MGQAHLPPKFGEYGGQFVPETLIPALMELEEVFIKLQQDSGFKNRLDNLLQTYAGRPTPLFFASRLTSRLGGAKIYLKREDLNHTGAHKINNALGQALLATEINKSRLIAETGAGQHGVATATVAALLGLECEIYMGSVDMERQATNVARMELLGARVVPVNSGSQTLKDAINEAIRDWVANSETSHYLLGSALGPHPYPTIVREFQRVIGIESRRQIMEVEGELPDLIIACVGGGSNSIGIFSGFVDDPGVGLLGVEAGGHGISPGMHAARFAEGGGGSPGVLHGCFTYVLQTEDGQINPTHSISAGLDYAAVGPEHSLLRETGRAEYTWVGDDAALEAFHILSREEGIIPALESSHAVAEALRLAPKMDPDNIIIVNLSGRGDKDLQTVLAKQSASSIDVTGRSTGLLGRDS